MWKDAASRIQNSLFWVSCRKTILHYQYCANNFWFINFRQCSKSNVGKFCKANEECGINGVCKVDPDSKCAKAQAAGLMIGCNHLR